MADALNPEIRRRLINAARAARAELPEGVGITGWRRCRTRPEPHPPRMRIVPGGAA